MTRIVGITNVRKYNPFPWMKKCLNNLLYEAPKSGIVPSKTQKLINEHSASARPVHRVNRPHR